MFLQPGSSPAPAYSDTGSPTKKGFSLLSPFKKRADSPTSSLGGGSDVGTPRSRMFPSFSNGQRKREFIKKLEEDLSLLQVQVHQQELQLGRVQQQLQQEETAKADAQERLNMQYFKANLLADMLVVQLLELEGSGLVKQPGRSGATQPAPQQQAAAGAGTAGTGPQQQAQQQQQQLQQALSAAKAVTGLAQAAAGAVATHHPVMVLEESSYD